MKKLLISLCCAIILIGTIVIIVCNSKNAVKEDNKDSFTNEDNSTEESKADINNLFSDIQEIESIVTQRIDIRYTLETTDQIDELMKLLEEIEYTEYVTDESIEDDVTEDTPTGSRTNGIHLVFYYKNDSIRGLDFSSTEEGEFAEYSEVSYEPFREKTRMYTTDDQVWIDVLVIMIKGEMKDLNEK
jgi:hypothetical protein